MLIKHLLCTGHYFKCWGYFSEQNRNPCLYRLHIQVRQHWGGKEAVAAMRRKQQGGMERACRGWQVPWKIQRGETGNTGFGVRQVQPCIHARALGKGLASLGLSFLRCKKEAAVEKTRSDSIARYCADGQ